MAEIWLARMAGPKGFEKVVVIKKLIDSLTEDEQFLQMFLDEARIAANLTHPNIVQIHDLGEQEGGYFIAMEYLAGESISSLMRTSQKAGNPLPVAYAARIVASVAEGLSYAHGR